MYLEKYKGKHSFVKINTFLTLKKCNLLMICKGTNISKFLKSSLALFFKKKYIVTLPYLIN